jgi:Leucine-rich repeat (LRR) protein
LETLVLAENGLREVSEQIGTLKRLRMLDLGHNQLTHVPEALGQLNALTDFLYLHDNRLTALPESLGKLTKLRYLNLSENTFEAFPECVTKMAGLLELRISDNALTQLPESIGQLSRLRELQIDLRGNPLTSLPDAMAALPTLGEAGPAVGEYAIAVPVDCGARSARMRSVPIGVCERVRGKPW